MHIANEPSKPLILHCTAGKDRTGVFCALVLSLCGVDDEVVAYEYSLTAVGLSEEWKETVKEHLMNNPALKGDEQGAINMISSKYDYYLCSIFGKMMLMKRRAENMLATLKAMREEFGDAERYVIEQCGLTKEDVENIRANLIVEEPAAYAYAKAKELQHNL